jgi:hypothetical protein
MVTKKGISAAAFDADFLAAARPLLDDGNRDLCRTLDSATVHQTLNMDFLCQALLDSDLTETLEQEVHTIQSKAAKRSMS